ncbi:conserved hypothetical protein [Phenylobacterium zucineum HLK1]|uniref:DUF488 domain-containing protein n=1 Tax=Phenylobacterium zucineum (strain HLK1) TaxID=450851 RepID=B4RB91_PHEZH|nr:DUF488 domain-containing protein [Phenylobacterium zucineum]ACG79736.1 conserved hypothetical protein [Phenylobacterium zucineum HLK1]
MKLATIGYEAAPQAAVIRKLQDAGIEVVIDVRAVAASRRAGFSKGLLSASLEDAGVDYVHLRALGTPKPGREAARKGRTAEMRAIFEEHLKEPQAQLQLAQAVEIARDRKAALLCFCAEARGCHRRIVAERMCEALPFEVEDL